MPKKKYPRKKSKINKRNILSNKKQKIKVPKSPHSPTKKRVKKLIEKNNKKSSQDIKEKENLDEITLNNIQFKQNKTFTNIKNNLIKKIFNNEIIEAKYFKKIDINKDGNCFFRCLAYYFEKDENKYKSYRKQIYRYIKNNYDNLKNNFPYEIINGNKIYYINTDISNDVSKIPLLKYIEKIQNEGEYAGDLEISCASLWYETIIRILVQDYNEENKIFYYKPLNTFGKEEIIKFKRYK